jgi:hypothetical protein
MRTATWPGRDGDDSGSLQFARTSLAPAHPRVRTHVSRRDALYSSAVSPAPMTTNRTGTTGIA